MSSIVHRLAGTDYSTDFALALNTATMYCRALGTWGGVGMGRIAPLHILVNTLTLFQSWVWADYVHYSTTVPPIFSDLPTALYCRSELQWISSRACIWLKEPGLYCIGLAMWISVFSADFWPEKQAFALALLCVLFHIYGHPSSSSNRLTSDP